MHLDFHVVDIDAEAERLQSLGARRISDEAVSEHSTRWHVMADPEGNEFCVCDGGHSSAGESTA
jgi:predicted enzyme related to lactoylglutathione lyase